jgi:acetyltransferase-like isoleucine patch superfamily enzyme
MDGLGLSIIAFNQRSTAGSSPIGGRPWRARVESLRASGRYLGDEHGRWSGTMRDSSRLATALRRSRIWKYRALSTCRRVSGSPIVLQPVLFLGEGAIVLGHDVELGWPTSASFYTGYCHIEASTPSSRIELGDGVQLNNNAFIKSEGPGIKIGANSLLGSGVTIYDSDFHDLHPDRRRGGQPRMAAVELGENVFIGDGVKILKGVRIGAHSVVGAGSVVTRSIPSGVIAAGNPAHVIRTLSEETAEDRVVALR